jgi:hypothetical protein
MAIVTHGVRGTLEEKEVRGCFPRAVSPFGGERESHSKSPECMNVIHDNKRISTVQKTSTIPGIDFFRVISSRNFMVTKNMSG